MSDSDSDEGVSPAARRERKEGEPEIHLAVPDSDVRNQGKEEITNINFKMTMPDGSVEILSVYSPPPPLHCTAQPSRVG